MSTPAKGATKKEKRKPISAKTSLNSPYEICWKALKNQEHKDFILNTLKVKISAVGLQKQRVKGFREWGSRRKSRKKACKPREDQKTVSEPAESVPTPSEPPVQGWTNQALRKQLAIGINEVTKSLERNEVSLVLVCNSAIPVHMTDHLILLSKTRSVPACKLPGLSESLSGLLGLKCVLALGFKRGAEAFEDVVGAITPVVPPLGVTWLPTDFAQKSEEKHTDAKKGQKRKLENTDEVDNASPVTLQPLKVKKIIPNPTKIRKPQKKKKQQKSSRV